MSRKYQTARSGAGKGKEIGEMMSNNISWLMTTPSGDCNFKNALKRATDEEIRETINNLDGKIGVKTKLKALEAELRRRVRR